VGLAGSHLLAFLPIELHQQCVDAAHGDRQHGVDAVELQDQTTKWD